MHLIFFLRFHSTWYLFFQHYSSIHRGKTACRREIGFNVGEKEEMKLSENVLQDSVVKRCK